MIVVESEKLKIAVIGSGIGGTTFTYELTNRLANNSNFDVDVHVYEKKLYPGGRMHHEVAKLSEIVRSGSSSSEDSITLELGATIYHRANTIIDGYVKQFELEQDDTPDLLPSDHWAVMDEKRSFVFESFPDDALFSFARNVAQIFWKFGLHSTFSFKSDVEHTVEQYLNAYKALLEEDKSFASVHELLSDGMDPRIAELVGQSLCEFTKDYDQDYVHHFIDSVVRVQYNQDCSVNALVGMVALFPVIDDDCTKLKEGNVQICQALLENAHQTYLHYAQEVISIHENNNSDNNDSDNNDNNNSSDNNDEDEIIVELDNGEQKKIFNPDDDIEDISRRFEIRADMHLPVLGNRQLDHVSQDSFDIVVIAHPFELSSIHLENIGGSSDSNQQAKDALSASNREFQLTHVTMVSGELNPTYFGKKHVSELPQCILTTESDHHVFSSLCTNQLLPDNEKDPYWRLYKIFSRETITDQQLDEIFTTRKYLLRWGWHAYPKLPAQPSHTMPPFRITNGLYYINAFESAISCMETEALAAINVVNLVINDLNQK